MHPGGNKPDPCASWVCYRQILVQMGAGEAPGRNGVVAGSVKASQMPRQVSKFFAGGKQTKPFNKPGST